MLIRTPFIFLFTSILFLHCSTWELEEVDSTVAGAEYAIPIGQGTFPIQAFFEAASDVDEFIIGPDGEVTVSYKSQEVSIGLEQILPELPIGLPVPIPDTLVEITLPSLNGLTIEKARLAGDAILFSFTSIVNDSLIINLSSNSFLKDGEAFEYTYEMPGGSVPNIRSTPSIPLEGYELNIPDQRLQFRYRATRKDGSIVPLAFTTFTIDKLTFDTFEGKIQRSSLTLPSGSIAISLFDNWQAGALSLINPSIELDIENSFGIPISIVAEQASIISKGGADLPLLSTVIDQPIPLAFPSIDQSGQIKATQVLIDGSNSNIEELFSSLPQGIRYGLRGIINPDNNEDTYFVGSGNILRGTATVKIPLHGFVQNGLVSDTFAISFENQRTIQEGELSWVSINSLPVAMNVEIIGLTAQNEVLGQMTPDAQPLIEAAPVMDLGNTEPIRNTNKITIPGTILENINLLNKIVVSASFSTYAFDNPVVITNNQSLEIMLGLKFISAK